jgi:hypothetical protein
VLRFAAIQFADQAEMVPSSKGIHDDSDCDQRCSEPQRQSVRLRGKRMLSGLEFLQEEPETGHHKTESHQGEAGANPRQKGPFSSQIITECGSRPDCCWSVHFIVPCAEPRESDRRRGSERRQRETARRRTRG